MDYLRLSITEMHDALLKGEITPLDLVMQAIKKAKEDNNNAFEYICEKEAVEAVKKLDESKKENLLWGIPYVIKDNFSTKDIPTTASSNILNGYIPSFDSEVCLRLAEQGAILIGKTTLDELAMGGSGMTGHLGWTYNPWDPTHKHKVGGSSSGSAAACAAGIVPFAIGSDTGDSARKPGSFSGLVGLKPTWGRISRYGMFPFAASLDHVGFFTRNVEDSAIVLSAIAGKDKKDATSSDRPVENYLACINPSLKGKRIVVIDEIFDTITEPVIHQTFVDLLSKLEEAGAIINHVHMDIDLCRAIYPTYIVISCAESTSNNAYLDGIKFGPRYPADDYESVIMEARTKGLSAPIKRRFVIGSYSLLRENQSEVFLRAQKCRRLIVNAVNEILKDNDSIFLPSAPTTAPLFIDNEFNRQTSEYLIADNYLAIANFGGQPSINVPIGFENGLPFGATLINKIFDEVNILGIAKGIEQLTGLSNLIAGDKK